MNILLTIKAVLNYLYNHLIDLVWTKKIKFQDGSEMITANIGGTFSLFDIKLLSQAIADKGFAYMCHTTRRDLAKADVPTLYDFILDKYNNADTGATSLTAGFSKDNHSLICLGYVNNKLYFIDENNDTVFYSNSYLSDGSAIQVNGISRARNMFAGNNCLIVVCDSGNSNKIFKINPTDNSVIELGTHDTDYEGEFKLVGNKIYFFPFYQDEAEYTKVYEFVDDETDNTMVVRDYNAYVVDIEYYNGYYYLISVNTNVKYILKGLSLNNLNLADSSKWELLATLTDGDFSKKYAQLFFVNNMCIMFTSLSGLRGKAYYCYDISSFTLLYSSIRELYGMTSSVWFVNNTFYFWEQWSLDSRPEFKYCSANDILDYTNFQSDNEISALNINSYFSTLIQNNLQLFGLRVSDRKIYSRGIVKTTYTDTYTINGSTVTIDYYKNNDFKICIKDGGTNDTNLETVFNYLGYLNYWLLDTVNETVAIQRDKNTYAVMFVGDDFIDDTNNLATNDYASVVLKNQIGINTINYFTGITGATLNTGLTLGNTSLVFKNGVLLEETQDYTISSSTITFLTALVSTDKISVINGNISSIDLSKYIEKPAVITDGDNTGLVIQANKIYEFTNSLTTLTLTSAEVSNLETMIYFTTGNSISFTDNSSLKWGGGSIPSLDTNTTYCIAIKNGLAEIDKFGR